MGIVSSSILLVTILVFVILYFIFKKFSPGKRPLGNMFYWISGIITTPLLYAAMLFIWYSISSSYKAKEFNKEGWSSDNDSRYEYVDDLINNKKLIGLTAIELENMLGEADNKVDSTLVFYIGYSPKVFLNQDPDWLEAILSNGVVDSVLLRY